MGVDILGDERRHSMLIDACQCGQVVDDVFIVVVELLKAEAEEAPELGDIVAD